ncbi:MAG: hypothetical protein EOP12_02330 [Pseudomonas sp.]|nr:MAG: hypothetical protein EOP12_02330 [Pseudomonas sp.]
MEPIDHATREGDGMLTRDQASLALVRDLRVLLVNVIQVLENDPALSGVVEMLTAADASIHIPER